MADERGTYQGCDSSYCSLTWQVARWAPLPNQSFKDQEETVEVTKSKNKNFDRNKAFQRSQNNTARF